MEVNGSYEPDRGSSSLTAKLSKARWNLEDTEKKRGLTRLSRGPISSKPYIWIERIVDVAVISLTVKCALSVEVV